MKKLVNFIIGILAGLSPLIIAGIFGVLIYNELQNIVGIIICVILGLLAIWAGIQIFKKVQQKGFVDFMTVVVATPDLDNLEPASDSKTKKRTAKELAELNHKNQSIFKGGTLKIFGDWFGEPYKNSLQILSIDFDESKKQMEIRFSQDIKIIIDEPDHILESPSVLKILTAQKVKLEFPHKKNNSMVESSYFKSYKPGKRKVVTKTNIDWTNQKIDASPGQDALIIFD